jgi:O-antigen/teichoic acid export membrane protein
VASGSRRAALTVTDQGLWSGSNFAVSVVVARVAGPAGLGGFSLAYAGWIILCGLHRSLITDPMAIIGDARDPAAKNAIRRGLAAELLIGLAGIVGFVLVGLALLAAGERTFGIPMLALAPWLPLLCIQDYWRWVGFMCRRPGAALSNDVVYNCVQGVGFAVVLVAGTHSTSLVIACWGLGAGAGALFGLRQNHVAPARRGGLGLLRERWSMSKWLAGTALVNNGATQAYQVVVAALLGPAGLGALKAAQNLVIGAAGVLIQAGGSIGLPEASRAYADKGWPGLLRVSRIVILAGLLTGLGSLAVVALWGGRLLTFIYGPSFGHYQDVAVILGLSLIPFALFLGPILVLKATRKTRWLFYGEVAYLVGSVASAAALTAIYGLDGAAASVIIAVFASWVVLTWFQHRAAPGAHMEKVAPPGEVKITPPASEVPDTGRHGSDAVRGRP